MKGGPLRWQARACHRGASTRRPALMLHVGLDLSRRRVDVCVLSDHGEVVAQTAAPADADGLRALAAKARGQRVRVVIESMNGARALSTTPWRSTAGEVLVADAQKVKGL